MNRMVLLKDVAMNKLFSSAYWFFGRLVLLAVVFGFSLCLLPMLEGVSSSGQDIQAEKKKRCSATAEAVFDACQSDADADYSIARAICINVSDDEARAECFADAKASRREARDLCRAQFDGRLEACGSLGGR